MLSEPRRIKAIGLGCRLLEELTLGLRSAAAAIVGPNNRVRGAISISAPLERCKEEEFHRTFPRKVRESSNVIQINIDTGNYFF